MRLTVETILNAEKAMRANGVQPPYVMRATDAEMRHLLLSAAKTEGVQLVAATRFRKAGLTLNPGERVVGRVGDTYLVGSR